MELSYAPQPGFQLDRYRNASISSSLVSIKEKFCASKTLCATAMSVSSYGEMADSAWSHKGFANISSSTSSSICVLRGLSAARVCSELELFFTSKPMRVLVIVVDAGAVLLSTFSGLKHRTHVTHTSIRMNTFSLLISTFKQHSSPTYVYGATSPPAVLNITSLPQYATLLPSATSIGIDSVGSVPSTTLNFT